MKATDDVPPWLIGLIAVVGTFLVGLLVAWGLQHTR